MFLAALKPNLAKLGATALIVITAMIYSALSAALTKESTRQMSQAFLGEPLVTKIKQITEAFPCERDKKIADIGIELAEKNSEKILSLRNKWLVYNFIVLSVFSYLSACLILSRNTSLPCNITNR